MSASRGRSLSGFGALLGVLALALILRILALSALDLSDLPGPGGVKMVTALATGHHDRDWATWAVASSLPLFSGDVVTACRALMLAGGLAQVLGAMLAAGALLGRRAAAIAGLLVAVWAQPLFVSVMIGADALSVGLAWLGVGLAWLSAERGSWGLPGVVIGALLTAFAVTLKINALPVLGLLALAPLLARNWRDAALAAAALLGALQLARWGFLPTHSGHVQPGGPALDLHTVRAGLERLLEFADRNPEARSVIQILFAGTVAALLPGGRWPQRVLLAAVGVGAMGLATESIGVKLRIRHLLAASLPAVVLLGCGLAWIEELARGLLARLHPRAGRLAAALSLGVSAVLLLDTWAYLHAWSALRQARAGAAATTLPAPPHRWAHAYARLSGLVFDDISGYGAAPLAELARTAPPGGVATIPLRDARERHLTAAAAVAGRRYRVLEAPRCCSGEADLTCARQVVAALDRAGAWLVLPESAVDPQRIPNTQRTWARLLTVAAGEDGEAASAWWRVWKSSGSGGPLPCRAGTR